MDMERVIEDESNQMNIKKNIYIYMNKKKGEKKIKNYKIN
jgi:hypothetical protein